MTSSLGMIGSELLSPALGPLLVGLISDAAPASGIPKGVGIELLIVPVAGLLTGVAYLIANRHVANHLRAQS